MATDQPTRLTEDQVAEVFGLIKDADSVELKLTVPDEARRATVQSLEMDPLDAQIRQVFFFDTPDLALNKAGVVVRGRRVQGKGDDSVVKLRPVVPTDLPRSCGRQRTSVWRSTRCRAATSARRPSRRRTPPTS